MAELGLQEAIEQIRQELREAIAAGGDAEIQFPVGEVTLEFQVGLTKTGEGSGKVNVWVLEAGVGGKVEHDRVQKVTVVLQPPVDPHGNPVKVSRHSSAKPG
ncbi:trypco2 family protein [Spongiactinospora sp. 9N601]|uniref:trypco2 family protein n=1 Tax=Spongiactinospora sp. 9N601 TaxID=3375149 RepID=UPI0037B385DC